MSQLLAMSKSHCWASERLFRQPKPREVPDRRLRSPNSSSLVRDLHLSNARSRSFRRLAYRFVIASFMTISTYTVAEQAQQASELQEQSQTAGSAEQTSAAPPAPQKDEERPTGLPKRVKWTFNFDAAWGTFGFRNSLYTNVRPDPSDNLSDNWFEGSIKPALSGSIALAKSE